MVTGGIRKGSLGISWSVHGLVGLVVDIKRPWLRLC